MTTCTFALLCACGLLALQGPRPTTAALTAAEQEEIVEKHNALRRGVQPTASNMMKMKWDESIAANAQRWADTCSMKQSPDSFRASSNTVCGENIAIASSKTSWTDSIQAWYDEVQDWKYGVGSVNEREVGHYNQVVASPSKFIGCGMALCPSSESSEYLYVCQYCPGGNKGVAEPYKSGPTCGDCPDDCDDKLCTFICTATDKRRDCAAAVSAYSCDHPEVASLCPGTCNCK